MTHKTHTPHLQTRVLTLEGCTRSHTLLREVVHAATVSRALSQLPRLQSKAFLEAVCEKLCEKQCASRPQEGQVQCLDCDGTHTVLNHLSAFHAQRRLSRFDFQSSHMMFVAINHWVRTSLKFPDSMRSRCKSKKCQFSAENQAVAAAAAASPGSVEPEIPESQDTNVSSPSAAPPTPSTAKFGCCDLKCDLW